MCYPALPADTEEIPGIGEGSANRKASLALFLWQRRYDAQLPKTLGRPTVLLTKFVIIRLFLHQIFPDGDRFLKIIHCVVLLPCVLSGSPQVTSEVSKGPLDLSLGGKVHLLCNQINEGLSRLCPELQSFRMLSFCRE